MISLLWTQVLALVGELRYCEPRGAAKKEKEILILYLFVPKESCARLEFQFLFLKSPVSTVISRIISWLFVLKLFHFGCLSFTTKHNGAKTEDKIKIVNAFSSKPTNGIQLLFNLFLIDLTSQASGYHVVIISCQNSLSLTIVYLYQQIRKYDLYWTSSLR